MSADDVDRILDRRRQALAPDAGSALQRWRPWLISLAAHLLLVGGVFAAEFLTRPERKPVDYVSVVRIVPPAALGTPDAPPPQPRQPEPKPQPKPEPPPPEPAPPKPEPKPAQPEAT
ncbi:MAG: hypothetical protein AAF772_08820, partial [Acidobacteriota bacterium]